MIARRGILGIALLTACSSTVSGSGDGGPDALAAADAGAPDVGGLDLPPPPPVNPAVPRRVVQVAAGHRETCALDDRGIAWCWGLLEPQQFAGVDPARLASCVTSDAGRQDPCTPTPAPVAFPEALAFIDVSGGLCGVGRSGRLYCSPGAGPVRIARPGERPANVPMLVEGLRDVTHVAGGCAVWGGGRLSCWQGDPRSPGGGAVGMAREFPWPAAIRALAPGVEALCALGADGRVGCLGSNLAGLLGEAPRCDGRDPAADNFHRDVRFPAGARRASAIAVTSFGSGLCVRWEDGRASCWGRLPGALIQSSEAVCCHGVACSTAPVDLPGGTLRAGPSTGGGRLCVVREDGRAWCADDGEEPLFEPRYAWAAVPSSRPVLAVASGVGHVCVLDDAGEVSCMGGNEFGQLGDGTRERRAAPVAVRFPWRAGP